MCRPKFSDIVRGVYCKCRSTAGQFFPHQTNVACADCLENNFISAGQQRCHTCRPNSDVVFAGQFFFLSNQCCKADCLENTVNFSGCIRSTFSFLLRQCCLPHPAGRANQDFRRLPPEQQVPQKHRSCASACTRRWLPDPALRGRTRPRRRRLLLRREGQEGRVAAVPATAAARAPY